MRLLAITATVVFLTLFVSLSSGTVEAKGGFVLSIQPEELEWGEPVRWTGTDWPEGEVEVSARFSSSRIRPSGAKIRSIAPGDDFSFDGTLLFENVSGLPEQPTPGWIELTVRVGEVEMWRSLVVTVDGRRPPDAAYVSGRVRNLPSNPQSFVIVWAPVDDPAAYAFTFTDASGEYQTRHLSEGEWSVGLYDISEQWHASDADLQAVIGYSKELGRDVTLMGRIITVGPGQPLKGIDFTLAAGPALADGAIRVGATPTEAPSLVASAQAAPTSASISNGWLGPTLLGTAGVLLLAFATATRWGFRRPR